MGVIRSADHNRVNLLGDLVKHFAVVGKALGLRMLFERPGNPVVAAMHIANCHHVLVRQRPEVYTAL